jgi:anti-sigma factor RsiW
MKPLTCEQLEQLWIPFLDGKLSEAEREKLEAHLQHCGACEARREGMLAVSQELELWEAPEPSPWFDARLRQRIAAETAAHPHANWWAALTPSFPLSVAAMLLMAALLVWTGGGSNAIAPAEQIVYADPAADPMEDVLHAIEEVDLLNQADFLPELNHSERAERTNQ